MFSKFSKNFALSKVAKHVAMIGASFFYPPSWARFIRPPEFDDFVFNENKQQSAKVDILAEIRYNKYEEIRYDISKHVKVYDCIISYDMFGWPKKAKQIQVIWGKPSICFHSSHDAVLSNGSTRIQWDQPQFTWLARIAANCQCNSRIS